MTDTIIVQEASEDEPEAEAEVVAEAEAEAVEDVTDAAVAIAAIEAERDIALAEIHHEAEMGHVEARVAEAEVAAEHVEGIEECRASIEALRTELSDLRQSLNPPPLTIVEELPPNLSEPDASPEAIEASLEEVVEEPAPAKRKALRWT